MEDDVKNLSDYLSIAWRRKFHILIPFVLLLVVTIATVFLLPPVYKSTGTILIESQQIPQELIQSTVTSFADERIQIIRQRIMTSQQLFGIIKKFDLYKDEINNTPRSEILEDMRERISIDRVSANVKNRRRGASALIAFTISFEHNTASIAQRVANELVTLFLDENIRARTARAEETSEFLKKESERLGSEIAVMEEQIASYKQDNEGSLPENLRLNLERVLALKTVLLETEGEINELNERRNLLTIDLETLSKEGNSGRSMTQLELAQQQDLQALQNRFISLSARYGSEHPDVKATKRQIDAFEEQYGTLGDVSELQQQQQTVEAELFELTKKYSPEHPDVKKLQRRLDGIESMIQQSGGSAGVDQNNDPNPELLQTRAKIEAVDANISRIQSSRREVEGQITELEVKISKTPQVERGLDALNRDYENTRNKYQEIKAKQLQAELSKSLEEEQKGERFTLLEPPLRPDKPVKPNRPKLFALGLILSMMSGLGVAGIAESLDGGIRGSRALATVTRMTPLATIPYIATSKDMASKKRNLKLIAIVIMVLGLAFVAAVHFLYKPLDLLWFIILRKLNLA